jgi:DNA excision repair protein ERCC-2
MNSKALKVSVRALVNFSVFPPDILPVSSQAMELGRQGHLARQAESKARAETQLKWQGNLDNQPVEVTGRMDLFDVSAEPPLIEEIKLSPIKVPEAPLEEHLLQAVCYGFMLCERDQLPAVDLRVSYVTPAGHLTGEFSQRWDYERLKASFFALLLPWAAWQKRLLAHSEKRDSSLESLPFPYPDYRPGQREMAAQAYTAIVRKRRLFAVMPTGTGKSAAVLYPALKALGRGLTLKVFCLTARGTQRIAMQKEADRMLAQGLHLHALTLNAKETLCPMEQMRCHPDHCERAKGHFLRQPAALEEALDYPVWDGDFVLRTADRHLLCPFEFSLSLCEIADLVICDYNYALDPQVRLSRIFEYTRNVTLLVDEAHNLPDRARDMLSGSISIRQLREFRRDAGKLHGRKSKVYLALSRLINLLVSESALDLSREIADGISGVLDTLGTAFVPGSMHLARDLICLITALRRKEEQEEDYTLIHHADKANGALTVLCLNPAPHLRQATKRLSGCVFYSATLSPLGAMCSLLGGESEDACLSLPSPFPLEHLKTLQIPLNTRYKVRENSLRPAAEAIRALFYAHPGKMIAYFPSFTYLHNVMQILVESDINLPVIIQQPGMDETQRNAFLEAFTQNENPLLGLCVLGGVFSEGVDLPGSALTSAAIIGVGLPQLNEERNLFRQRMESVMGDGFGFAYRFPGMHKVLQAAGRLIRSENDRGVLLLLDDRYTQEEYSGLLPAHILMERVQSIEDIVLKTQAFWQENMEGSEWHG